MLEEFWRGAHKQLAGVVGGVRLPCQTSSRSGGQRAERGRVLPSPRYLHGATFYNWRRWSRTQRPETGRVSFTEIGRVAESQPRWAVEVVLVSGAVVRVSGAADVHLVRALLGALV